MDKKKKERRVQMRLEILWLFLGMAAVTYIPRAIPVVFMDKLKMSPKFEKFLRLIPYTVMAALILPSVVFVNPDYPAIGIEGGLVAAILAWLRAPVMACILGAVGANMVMYAFVIPH